MNAVRVTAARGESWLNLAHAAPGGIQLADRGLGADANS